jgi:cytochrome c oxidase subunit 1
MKKEKSILIDWLTTVDHKKIGILYFVSSLVFLIIGGFEALLIRTQLFVPNNDILIGHDYNKAFTMHGTTMLFLVIMPLNAAFFNFIMPLQIGARDVAFPRLNAFTYWIFLFGGLFLHASFFIPYAVPDGSWFGYANLSSKDYLPYLGMDFWVLSLQVLGLSSLVASFNFFVTIINMRAKGMSFFRMPMFTWTTLITQVLIIMAFPVITIALALLMFDRIFGTAFYNPAAGGDVILWEHLFWVFGHPEVYILILPPMGYVSEILATQSRKPVFGYPVMVISVCIIGFLGFGVWAHHMFSTGMGKWANAFFAVITMTISIPTGVKIFNWLFTMWGGKVKINSSFLYAVGFILMFTIGGITGVMHASVPVDLQQHDTYFVVGHFHYVLIGGSVMGLMAAIHYWFPKIFGRILNEKIAIIQFVLLLVGQNMTFMAMHFLGVEGMPRRIYTYGEEYGWTYWNQVATIGAYVQAVAFILFFYNMIKTMMGAKNAPADPWNARTLEWSISSPPPEFNFYKSPEVQSGDAFWHKKEALGEKAIEKLKGDEKVHLPNPSWYPLISSLSFMLMPIGLIFYSAADKISIFGISLMVISFVTMVISGLLWALEPAE